MTHLQVQISDEFISVILQLLTFLFQNFGGRSFSI